MLGNCCLHDCKYKVSVPFKTKRCWHDNVDLSFSARSNMLSCYIPNQSLKSLCYHLAFLEMRKHDKPIRATIPHPCLARQIRVHCTQASCSLLAKEVIHLFMLIERYWVVCWKEGRRMEAKIWGGKASKKNSTKDSD